MLTEKQAQEAQDKYFELDKAIYRLVTDAIKDLTPEQQERVRILLTEYLRFWE